MRFEQKLRIWLLVFILSFLAAPWQQAAATTDAPAVAALDSVGLTVSDMDRSVDFFSKVLSFEKMSDVEVSGPGYERLQGLFGLRARIVRMKLGDESIELTEYLTPNCSSASTTQRLSSATRRRASDSIEIPSD